jgi:hypothetical protein
MHIKINIIFCFAIFRNIIKKMKENIFFNAYVAFKKK